MATSVEPVWRNPVSSTAIVSSGYDPDRQILAVEFASGNVYHHFNVPPDVADAFHADPSKGRAYAQKIRGQYTSSAVDEPKLAACASCGDKGLAGYTCRDCGTRAYGAV